MKTKIGLTLCALGVVAVAWAVAGPEAPRTTGRVLVLANEQTIEGNIERQGEQYRVRRSVGEVWVQRDEVLRLCEDHREAYLFLRSRANLHDPDEHVRLSNWCQAHGLKKEAIEEARTAVQMRPNDAAALGLLHNLERAQKIGQTTPEPRPHHDTEPPPPVDTNSLSVFVTRVQPILMNACANCHATGRGGSFRLIRSYDRGWISRKTTLQNLSAVLAQLNTEQPPASLFLTKAVSIHGDMPQPALKDRDIPAFKTMEDWVRTTIESNPQLSAKTSATATFTQRQAMDPIQKTAKKSDTGLPVPLERTAPVAKETVTPSKDMPPAGADDGDADPRDNFDPIIFNRQMHPSQKREDGKR